MASVPRSVSDDPAPGHNESKKPRRAPLKVAETPPVRKGKSPPFTDAEAAALVWKVSNRRRPETKAQAGRLSADWGELAAAALDGGPDSIDHCLGVIQKRDAEAFGRIKAALDEARPAIVIPSTRPAQGPTRPDIEVALEWHKSRDDAVRALATHRDLYQRSERIVTVGRESRDEAPVRGRARLPKQREAPRIIEVSESNIGCALTEVASFFTWKQDKYGEDKAVKIAPTRQLINSVATLKFWPGLPILEKVAECPFPRFDGTIVSESGYDPDTRTFLTPTADFLPVPDKPTHADAVAAWERLADHVIDFPFASEDDRVVYLAGVLTVIARPAIDGPTPGICVTSNRPGTGKGYLIDAMVLPGTGRKCPTMTYPDANEEAKKVKVSIARAGMPVVHFDNLDNGSSYGGSGIDSTMTADEVRERLLGGNEAPAYKVRSTFFMSGNNISPRGDAFRRWLTCRFETDLEHPERRKKYKHPRFHDHLFRHRAEMVRDGLIILKAHALAGRPRPDWEGIGSFDDWDEIVRPAVWFATGRDCTTVQGRTTAEAPERNANIALLAGIREVPGGRTGQRGVTASVLVKLAAEGNGETYPILRHALEEIGHNGKVADSRQLGNLLKSLVNSTIGGMRLYRHDTKLHHAVAWYVDKLEPVGWECGSEWESIKTPAEEDFGSLADAITFAINTKTVLRSGPGHSHALPHSHPVEGQGSSPAPSPAY